MKRQTNEKAIDLVNAICSEIGSGVPVSNSRKIRCPECNSEIKIFFDSEGTTFVARCNRDQFHFSKHYGVKVQPPDWKEFVGGTWLD